MLSIILWRKRALYVETLKNNGHRLGCPQGCDWTFTSDMRESSASSRYSDRNIELFKDIKDFEVGGHSGYRKQVFIYGKLNNCELCKLKRLQFKQGLHYLSEKVDNLNKYVKCYWQKCRIGNILMKGRYNNFLKSRLGRIFACQIEPKFTL